MNLLKVLKYLMMNQTLDHVPDHNPSCHPCGHSGHQWVIYLLNRLSAFSKFIPAHTNAMHTRMNHTTMWPKMGSIIQPDTSTQWKNAPHIHKVVSVNPTGQQNHLSANNSL